MLQPTPLQNSSDHNATSTIPQLSVSLKETGLSEQLLSGMWIKAAELAADPSLITDAPRSSIVNKQDGR